MTDPAPDDTADPGDDSTDARWFRRFRFSAEQAEAVQEQVGRSCRAIDQGADPAELLAHLLELTWALTPLGREADAASFGRLAVDVARARGDTAAEIEALLHTATAVQYAGQAAEARTLFEAGIDLTSRSGQSASLHYLQHHLGRLEAEALDPAAATELFEAAVRQRREIGDEALIRSTEMALAEVATWTEQRGATS